MASSSSASAGGGAGGGGGPRTNGGGGSNRGSFRPERPSNLNSFSFKSKHHPTVRRSISLPGAAKDEVDEAGERRACAVGPVIFTPPQSETTSLQKCKGAGSSVNYARLSMDMSSFNSLFEQVGWQRILSMLESQDANVRIHAAKAVANLAAEEANQEKIVSAGGLSLLLMLLRSDEDETVLRVAAGAIANLAMNEANQELVVAEGGISLLAVTAEDAEDPQTLRMVAGAIANLCGNGKLQTKLRSEGGIRALLGMVRCRHPDVLRHIARGIANFAKCESRAAAQGTKTGKSLLIEDGALPWIVQNASNEASPIRRRIELALCHLAQHEVNARDMIVGGALWEMVRISRDSSREDIRSLARRTLGSIPAFQAELRRLQIEVFSIIRSGRNLVSFSSMSHEKRKNS